MKAGEGSVPTPPSRVFWGKLRDGLQLPLSQHCLDVAIVFRVLAALPLVRRRLEAAAGDGLEASQLDRFAVIAFLHDIGKANLGFQDKPFAPKAPRAGHIRELAPLFFELDLCSALRSALKVDTLSTWFHSTDGLEQFLLAAWSHHGEPVRFDESEKTGNYYLAKTCWWRSDGKRDPFAEIASLLIMAQAAFPSAFEPDTPLLPDTPQLQHRFAGLLMLADWLGSHEAFFPIARQADDPVAFSSQAAKRAVEAVGLISASYQNDLAERTEDGFVERFGFSPRPLQAAMDGLALHDPEHLLLIAEAETGSGKTEAALARFFRLFSAGEVDALYFALPTRVAARELYGRVCGYVERVFPDPALRPHALLAVPGYAQVDRVVVSNTLPDESVRWDDDSHQHREHSFWAAEHPKRFLAATVAVGTIDQALLSILQTRHAHLRSACLDRCLLVVDEVHASDPYMRRLLAGLLAHHVGLGGYALLLSATLGARLRTELINSAGSTVSMPDYLAAISTPYPALTGGPGTLMQIAIDRSMEPKAISFEQRACLMHPEVLIPEIVAALRAGARILVVLNTVDRVVALQRAVEYSPEISNATLFKCDGAMCPHHGRFAPADREVLDKTVSARLGKDSPADPLLLIGTQTLEQSLDIDADLLITDLCPADVLLQRVGRLHRHERLRPPGFGSARCLVLVPEQGDLEELMDDRGYAVGVAKRVGLGSVYPDLRCLELTRRLLIEMPKVTIPLDNRTLVEGATHTDRLKTLQGQKWIKHGELVDGAELAKEISAHLAAAVYNRPFGEFVFNELNATIRTRLGLDTLRLPLDRAVKGPFGRRLTEMVIPGHLAPTDRTDEYVTVLALTDHDVLLDYGGRRYRYSRFGLEKADEPSD